VLFVAPGFKRFAYALALAVCAPVLAGAVERDTRDVDRRTSAGARRREVVAQQIEAHAAAGSITDAQMQELQAEIAQLDDASRKQMMNKLIRTLNSGDIKGRL
jgi:TolA-binding protein